MPLFRRKKQPGDSPAASLAEQAVIVHLTVETGREIALDEIEDPLIEAIDRAQVGEFDGNEIGPDAATLYMYGPDADRLFAVVEPILRRASLPAGSQAVVRYGGPGSEERRVAL